jgi:pSer/pThr/pTyr-binding forkhead associated (FHA) protein
VKILSLRFRIRAASGAAAAASVERVVEIEPHEGDLVIGRRRGQDIELPFVSVSEQHARLSRSEKGWLLADLGSANGTFLNGRRLTPFVAQAFSAGDVLRLASVELIFEGEGSPGLGADGQKVEPESTATLARRLVSDLFGTSRPAEVAHLVVRDGPGQGRELRLEVVGCRYRVGRGTGCNLVVPDDDISREHAEFERRWDGVFVRDLDSKNGVLLMGERLAGERRLSDGDVLRLGQTTFRLEDPEDRYLRQLQEVEARACQTAQASLGAESAASADLARPAGQAPLLDTHTQSEVVGPGRVALSQAGLVARGRRSSWHAPLVLMVIAAVVLVGAIALALSFILGT